MNKRTKVIIGISVSVIAVIIFLIINGLHLMAIEDHYGDLQSAYYRAETGDVIVDNIKRIGFLKKLSDRIYVDENGCMRELYNWVYISQEPVKFKVYRPEIPETLTEDLSYNEFESLIKEKKLKPIVSY